MKKAEIKTSPYEKTISQTQQEIDERLRKLGAPKQALELVDNPVFARDGSVSFCSVERFGRLLAPVKKDKSTNSGHAAFIEAQKLMYGKLLAQYALSQQDETFRRGLFTGLNLWNFKNNEVVLDRVEQNFIQQQTIARIGKTKPSARFWALIAFLRKKRGDTNREQFTDIFSLIEECKGRTFCIKDTPQKEIFEPVSIAEVKGVVHYLEKGKQILISESALKKHFRSTDPVPRKNSGKNPPLPDPSIDTPHWIVTELS